MTVIKCGGSVLQGSVVSLGALATFVAAWRRRGSVVLVHGGGPAIAALEQRLQLQSTYSDQGQRITGTETLEVVVQSLCGLVSSRLVAGLVAAGLDALGLSGADGGLLRAQLKDCRRLGWVGQIASVRADLLHNLCRQGFVPVVAPVSLYQAQEGDPRGIEPGQLLNVNADDAASAIAQALGAQNLIYLSDVAGIVGADQRVMAQIAAPELDQLLAEGTVRGGMAAKVLAAQAAVRSSQGRLRVCIADGRPKSLAAQQPLEQEGGTWITL